MKNSFKISVVAALALCVAAGYSAIEIHDLRTSLKYVDKDTSICAGSNVNSDSFTAHEKIDIEPLKKTSDNREVDKKVKHIVYQVPECDTNFKSYMSYRALTVKNSPQYKLQQHCWTDKMGLRRQTDDYVIAVGTYYSNTIGDRFLIELDNGFTFTAIVGDIKANRHTNPTNQYTAVYNWDDSFKSANVIEFLVDIPYLPREVKNLGTVSSIEDFDGNIVSMKKIVE